MAEERVLVLRSKLVVIGANCGVDQSPWHPSKQSRCSDTAALRRRRRGRWQDCADTDVRKQGNKLPQRIQAGAHLQLHLIV